MPNATERITDLFSAPMEAVIVTLGTAIARAQREVDRHSLELQREINEDPQLADLGLQATWYQMPRTELELSMAVAMEERKAPPPGAPAPTGPRVLEKYPLKQIHLQPVNAAYSNLFNFNVSGASRIKLTVVPVPPPAADSGVVPKLTRDQVTDLVKPFLTDDPAARLSLNFNGQARLWYAVQYKQVGDQTQRLVVVVDDETRAIAKQVRET